MPELLRPLSGLSKKPSSAFLDSNVFIYGRLEDCNSRLIIFLAQLGEFQVFTSELVVEEVERFFRTEISREAGYLAARFVESLSQVVRRDKIAKVMGQLKGKIKERDLENLAVVRRLDLRHLVSYDDDYRRARVNEYTTPRAFVKLFELEPYKTEY
jgi:predicted nucleic acid-binding protein